MRQNAKKVLSKFACKQAGSGGSKRTIWTDGTRVYSYNMPIAARGLDGKIAIVAYEDGPSRTTRSHIRACQVAFPEAVTLSPALPRDWLVFRHIGD